MTSVNVSMPQSGTAHTLAANERSVQTGVWLLLAEIVMLFAAFTSAMVVRRGATNDWVDIVLPAVIRGSQVLLLAGCVCIALAKRYARKLHQEEAGSRQTVIYYLSTALLCGLGFLGCQWLGFRHLAMQGITVASNPAASFLYVFAIAHSVHLLGGMIALVYVVLRVLQRQSANGEWLQNVVSAVAIYWYGMTVLWFYILVVFV